MKITWFAPLAAAGLALTSPFPIIQSRNLPEPGSQQARELYDLVKKGMQTWGLTGAIRPSSKSFSGPLPNLPGGMPELNRPHPPKQDGVPGTPGQPLGPRKKQGRIYPRRKSCPKKKRDTMPCSIGMTTTGRASRYPKLRPTGQGGVMVAFSTLSPHAHDILEAVKNWDNPIGSAVAWFDESIAGLQEAIGGKYVPEIHGNELKLWLICLFRNENPRNPDLIDYACQRRRDAPLEEQKQQQAINGLNQVAELCELVEEDNAKFTDAKMKAEILTLCEKYAETLEGMIDANAGLILLGEWARARTLNTQDFEEGDQATVEEFIQKGAFGPVAAANQTEASAIASLYVAHMSTYSVLEIEEDGSEVLIDHSRPPAWFELLEMGAGFVPEDRAAIDEALTLLKDTPHLRQFDNGESDGRFDKVQTCWDHASLLLFQPELWDTVSAGMTYLEGKIRDSNSDLACLPCRSRRVGWVLRCGSAIP